MFKKFSKNGGELEITRLPQSRLTKSEAAHLADRTIAIVKKYNPGLLGVKQMFDLLVEKEPLISVLDITYGVDPMRLFEAKSYRKLMFEISDFKLAVRKLSLSHDETELSVLNSAIEANLRHFNKSRNRMETNRKVAGFIELLQYDKTLTELVDSLNLSNQVLSLIMAFEAVNTTSITRNSELSKRPKIETHRIIKLVYGAVDSLYKLIEVKHTASLLDTETNAEGEDGADNQPDYAGVINELNQLARSMRLSMRLRDLHNKRKRDASQNGDVDETFENDAEITDEADATNDSNEQDASNSTQLLSASTNGSSEMSLGNEKAATDDKDIDAAANSKQ